MTPKQEERLLALVELIACTLCEIKECTCNGVSPGETFCNDGIQDIFTITCPVNHHPVPASIVYEVPAGKYCARTSQTDVDNKAMQDLVTNGPTYAQNNIVCTENQHWFNIEICDTFTKSDCPPNYSGSTVQYCVPAGTYKSYVSQLDADDKARLDVATNGQDYADTNGTCTEDTKYCNAEICEKIERSNCQPNYYPLSGHVCIPAGVYCVYSSQKDADDLAENDLNINKQTIINGGTVPGSQIIIDVPSICEEGPKMGNQQQMKSIQKDDCILPYIGTIEDIICPANTYFVYVSPPFSTQDFQDAQDAANQQALNWLNSQAAQDIANQQGECIEPEPETDFQFELSGGKAHSFIVSGNTGGKFKVDIGYDPVTETEGTVTEYTFTSDRTVTIPSAINPRIVRIYDYGSEITKFRMVTVGTDSNNNTIFTPTTEVTKVIRLKSLIDVDINQLFAGQQVLTHTNYLNGSNGSKSQTELSKVTRARSYFATSTITQVPLNVFKGMTSLMDVGHPDQGGGAFWNCQSLTTIPVGGPRGGTYKGNVSIFDDNPLIDTASYCFQHCINLTDYPEYLFQMQLNNILYMNNCFFGSGITIARPAWGTIQAGNSIWGHAFGIWGMFSFCPNLTTVPANLFDGVEMCLGDVTPGGIANLFERSPFIQEFPMTLFHKSKNLKHFRATFNGCYNAKFHYNMFWACPKNMNSMATAFSSMAGHGYEIPECFFRVMQRDGSGNFIKDLTLPYYSSIHNCHWNAAGKQPGQPSGQYITAADLEPMEFDNVMNFGNGHEGGFQYTFYNSPGFVAIGQSVYEGIKGVANMIGMFQGGSYSGNPLSVPDIALTVKSIKQICERANINTDILNILTQNYPELTDVNRAFQSAGGLTGAGIPMITNINKLGKVAITGTIVNHQSCFGGCISMSDFATMSTNYFEWVRNALHFGAPWHEFQWDAPNKTGRFRMNPGSGYLRGLSRWIADGYWTYLEGINPSFDFSTVTGDSGGKPLFFGWGGSGPGLSAASTAFAGVFGTAHKGTFATYNDMITAYPMAADTQNGEILFPYS
jgi:hypothetical protein